MHCGVIESKLDVSLFHNAVRQTWNVAPPCGRPTLSTFVQAIEPAMKIFVASPELPWVLSVSRWSVTPITRTSTDAWPVTVPADADVNVTEQMPADVPLAQVSPETVSIAPFESVSVTATTVPSGAARIPAGPPSSTRTVTVKVCSSPIPLVSSGPIRMNASTKRLCASPVFPPRPSVWRNTESPPTCTDDEAWPVTSPGLFDVKTIVHCPLTSVFGPTLSQVLAAAFRTAKAPREFVNVKSTCSPAAATQPAPSPAFSVTVTVNVCVSPTRLTSSGAIAILASTNRLVASPLFCPEPSVSTNVFWPSSCTVADACPLIRPGVIEVKVTVHLPPTIPVAQLLLIGLTTAPFDAVSRTVTIVPSGAGPETPATVWFTQTV